MLPIFFHFLQDGFLVEARVRCSVTEFLRERCRLSQEAITKRISTVFLDGQPVDDMEHAIVDHNSTLALSGAMPGLVGAVMRSNSPLRSFRSSITHSGDDGANQHRQGLIRLKLFNTVMSELGPRFLGEGILLEPLAVRDFLAKLPENGPMGAREILLDRKPIEMPQLLDAGLWSEFDLVSFSVRTPE